MQLIGMIKDQQINALLEWPQSQGGGITCVNLICLQIFKIINLGFHKIQNEKEIGKMLRKIYQADIVTNVIQQFGNIHQDNIYCAISLLSKLVLHSSDNLNFAQQFVQNDGLLLFQKHNLLNNNLLNVILESINILSHLARISKEYYEAIHRINMYQNIKKLFKHQEAMIRSKICNLLGNLCRHNGYFYDQFIKYSLIKDTIDCCADKDSNTRKFACFALGNAGFHNDKLYESLKSSISILVQLLSDSEEKTRANAAGALGNYGRNSNILVPEMLKQQVIPKLIELINNEKPNTQQPVRIALFSLGNLSVFNECRKIMIDMNVIQLTRNLSNNKDEIIKKYSLRIIQKLEKK